jgi:transposase
MVLVTVGIDLAKRVFAVHGVDETGKPALVRPKVAFSVLDNINMRHSIIAVEVDV